MAEPGFYRCKTCKHCWSRMEFKMQRNPPRVCPRCNAPDEQQEIDEERERAYIREVYSPIVEAIFGDKPKP